MGSCSGCHGADGAGGVGPDLTTGVPQLTDEELENLILNHS